MPLLSRSRSTFSGKTAFAAALTIAFSTHAAAAAGDAAPEAKTVPVIDTYHGVAVADPYRWMEDKDGADYRAWLTAQADFSRYKLDALPGRAALAERLRSLSQAAGNVSGLAWGGQHLFYLALEPGRNSARLMVREGGTGEPRVLLDPDTVSTPGQRQAIGDFTPSRDGRRVAVNLAAGGSEQSVLFVLDVASGKLLDERIDRVYGGSWTVSWLEDGEQFFYVRNPGAGGALENTRIFLHRLGRPVDQDPVVFGPGVHPDMVFEAPDYSYFLIDPASRYVVATTVPGVSSKRHFFVATLADVLADKARWRRLASPADQWFRGYLAGDHLYVMSHEAAPGNKLLKIDLAHPNAAPALVLPPSAMALDDAVPARDGLYVKGTVVGTSRLLQVPFDGGTPQEVALPLSGSIRELTASRASAGAWVKLEGWAASSRVLAVGAGPTRDTGLLPPAAADFSQIETEMVFVPGADGVRIPMTLVHRKGLPRDGQRPTILTAYGAYGLPREPRFEPMLLAWLERGGLFAVAHVRGGGEYGAEWHAAGRILTKSNTIRDLVACAEALVRDGHTRPAKLAVHGASAGGIAVGGAITERPDLFAVAHDEVGVSDLLRSETTSNGQANVSEFGTVKDRYQFLAMQSVSPLHRVVDGTLYPAVILTTGINDARVPSWQPAKFAARLQAATSSGRPVLLRVDMDGGHGAGGTRSQRIAQFADVWSFFLSAMNEPGFAAAP
ncbi:MAG TPA: prolyl oligopeptidase family serine peptidase [Ideonella sp.]|uniref:prolyl oligopeptidase family serine peptidase n=1 Tax=Ideonella sp. TaxID=1929293 RepID=UPI002E34ED0F|nr:prolyl oligopeptidase family serine peptidase [Ideonella sp.]HEX5684884.1 prolyl oligopeptidase family serine peptidase [Ideonella sp.]